MDSICFYIDLTPPSGGERKIDSLLTAREKRVFFHRLFYSLIKLHDQFQNVWHPATVILRFFDWLIDRLVDWLIDWFHWLIDSIDWLIHWLIDWFHCLIDWFHCLIDWLIDWWIWLIDWLMDLIDWLIDLIDLIDWLDPLIDWLIDCILFRDSLTFSCVCVCRLTAKRFVSVWRKISTWTWAPSSPSSTTKFSSYSARWTPRRRFSTFYSLAPNGTPATLTNSRRRTSGSSSTSPRRSPTPSRGISSTKISEWTTWRRSRWCGIGRMHSATFPRRRRRRNACWCTVKWEWVGPRPWSLRTPWRPTIGICSRPWTLSKSDAPWCSQIPDFWSSWRNMKESSKQGEARLRSIDWLIGPFSRLFLHPSIDWSIGWLVSGRSIYCLIPWLIDWLVGGWAFDWLIDWSEAVFSFSRISQQTSDQFSVPFRLHTIPLWYADKTVVPGRFFLLQPQPLSVGVLLLYAQPSLPHLTPTHRITPTLLPPREILPGNLGRREQPPPPTRTIDGTPTKRHGGETEQSEERQKRQMGADRGSGRQGRSGRHFRLAPGRLWWQQWSDESAGSFHQWESPGHDEYGKGPLGLSDGGRKAPWTSTVLCATATDGFRVKSGPGEGKKSTVSIFDGFHVRLRLVLVGVFGRDPSGQGEQTTRKYPRVHVSKAQRSGPDAGQVFRPNADAESAPRGATSRHARPSGAGVKSSPLAPSPLAPPPHFFYTFKSHDVLHFSSSFFFSNLFFIEFCKNFLLSNVKSWILNHAPFLSSPHTHTYSLVLFICLCTDGIM